MGFTLRSSQLNGKIHHQIRYFAIERRSHCNKRLMFILMASGNGDKLLFNAQKSLYDLWVKMCRFAL